MVDSLDKLELLQLEKDAEGKVLIPDMIQNLFSSMDFEHDGKIAEEEFLKATMHYR